MLEVRRIQFSFFLAGTAVAHLAYGKEIEEEDEEHGRQSSADMVSDWGHV